MHPAPHSTAELPVLPGPHSVCMGAWASEKLLLFLSLVLISTCLTCTIAFYMYIHNCTKVRTDVDMSKGMAAKAVHVIVCIEGVTAVQCRRDGNQSHAHPYLVIIPPLRAAMNNKHKHSYSHKHPMNVLV